MKRIFSLILILAVCIYLAHELNFIFKKARIQSLVLAKSQFSYDRIRDVLPGSEIARQAKKHLPENSIVELPDAEGIMWVAIRYEFYPIKVKEQGDYVIHLQPSLEEIPQTWQTKNLPFDAYLFAKPGHAFMDQAPLPPHPSLGHIALFSLIMACINILSGRLMLLVLSRHGPPQTISLSASYLTGYLVLTGTLWLWLLFGGTLTRQSVTLIWSIMLAALFMLKTGLSQKNTSLFKPSPADKPEWRSRVLFSMSTLAVLAVFISIASYPIVSWDPMSHWILKSKILFLQGRLDFSYTHNNYYPILWPLNIAAQFSLLNGTFDEVAKWTSGFFFIAFISQLTISLKTLGVKRILTNTVALLFLAAFVHDRGYHPWQINFQYANAQNILLAYLAGFLTIVIVYLKDRRPEILPSAVLMACGLCLTKLEGSVIILISAFFLWVFRDKKSGLKTALAPLYLVFPVILAVAWALWNKAQGFYISVYHLSEPVSWAKVSLLGQVMAKQLRNSESFYICLVGILTGILLAPRRKWQTVEKFLAWAGTALAIFSGTAVLGWTEVKIQEDFRDVAPRLFLFAAVFLTLLWSSRMFSRTEEST